MRNNSGFSLVAVLIGLMVASIGFVSVVKMVNSSATTQRLIEGRTEFDTARSSVQHILDSKTLCGTAFKNADGNGVQLPAATPPLESDAATHISISKFMHSGETLMQFPSDLAPAAKLTALKIVNAVSDGVVTFSGTTYNKYVGKIRLTGELGDQSSRREVKYEFTVPLLVNDSTNQIAGCQVGVQMPRVLQGTSTCPDTPLVPCTINLNFPTAYDEVPRIIANISKYRFKGPCRADEFRMDVRVTNLNQSGATLSVAQGADPDVGCGGYHAEEVSWMVIGPSSSGWMSATPPTATAPVAAAPSTYPYDAFDDAFLNSTGP